MTFAILSSFSCWGKSNLKLAENLINSTNNKDKLINHCGVINLLVSLSHASHHLVKQIHKI